MAAHGRHLVQPLVAGVRAVPVEAPPLWLAEASRFPDAVGGLAAHELVGIDDGPGPRVERQARLHGAVDLCGRGSQFRRQLRRVPEHRQPAAGPQHTRGVRRARHRIHPVPGLRGDDGVEFPPGAVPVLELGHLGLEPGLPRHGSHPVIGVDAEHPAPGALEQPGSDSRPAADVQYVAPRAGRHDPVYEGTGIARPGAVVPAGVRAERLRYPPLPMCLEGPRLLWRYSGHTPTLSGQSPTRRVVSRTAKKG